MVASFTDAWIETRIYIRSKSKAFVASFTDAWIETNSNRNYGGSAKVASFTDAWIETSVKPCGGQTNLSHLLQMRGLKPRPSMDSHRQNQVASFTDAWIETCAAMARFWRLRRIFYRCVD